MKTPVNYEVSELSFAEQQSIKGGSVFLTWLAMFAIALIARAVIPPLVEKYRENHS